MQVEIREVIDNILAYHLEQVRQVVEVYPSSTTGNPRERAAAAREILGRMLHLVEDIELRQELAQEVKRMGDAQYGRMFFELNKEG